MQPEQHRRMGLAATIALVVGESIALGIFLTPAAMAKSLGSPLLLAAVWCGMGAIALCGALCYSELAVRYPQAGGEYVYLRHGYGNRIAFLYGWMSAAVLDPGLAAALAVGAAPYVQSLLPVSAALFAWIPAIILLTLAVINYTGTRLSGRIMAGANLLKIRVLFALVAWAFVSGHATTANLMPLAHRRLGSEAIFPAIAGATMNAFFSFGGWWEAGKIAGEVRNPSRNLPLAFTGGVLLVTAVYLLVSFAFLSVVPVERIVSNTAFVAQFGEALFGAAGSRVLSACVLLSVLGGLRPSPWPCPASTTPWPATASSSPYSASCTPALRPPPTPCCSTPCSPSSSSASGPSIGFLPTSSFLRSVSSRSPSLRFSVPQGRSGLVVSCRAHLLHLRMHPHRPHDPHA